MTVSEYALKEEQCVKDTIGKYIDYDGMFGSQCWDLVEYYVINYLGIPNWVLAGCDYVNNLLVEPKISDVLKYFDEIPTTQMIKGDIVIWERGHIAIFDHWDGINCWYLTQNTGTGENPKGTTYIGILNLGNAKAFRLKGIVQDPELDPEPEPTPINNDELLDLVRRTIRGDFGNGQDRINALGKLYDEIQYQVDQNIAFGLTNWDDIRLF